LNFPCLGHHHVPAEVLTLQRWAGDGLATDHLCRINRIKRSWSALGDVEFDVKGRRISGAKVGREWFQNMIQMSEIHQIHQNPIIARKRKILSHWEISGNS